VEGGFESFSALALAKLERWDYYFLLFAEAEKVSKTAFLMESPIFEAFPFLRFYIIDKNLCSDRSCPFASCCCFASNSATSPANA
jgi:hypothetical protein